MYVYKASPRGDVMHTTYMTGPLRAVNVLKSSTMYVCYVHAHGRMRHASPYAHVDEGLHVDSAYTNATYVAGAACMRAHTYEHDREVCRKTSYTAVFLDEFPQCM